MSTLTPLTIFRASLLTPGTIDESDIIETFERLSPTPRVCIDYQLKPEALSKYEADVSKAISNVTPAQLAKLSNDTRGLTMDAISEKIYLLSRENREEVFSNPVVMFITPSIKSRLANQFQNLERAEQLRLYCQEVPASRGITCMLFESMAQRDFQTRIVLRLVRMVKLDRAPRGKLPQWYSSHAFLNNSTLEMYRQVALQQSVDINIEPSRTEEFSDQGPLSPIEQDVFYVPVASNQEALDSFILHGGNLFILQFTIAKTQSIKQGLLRFFEQLTGVPPMSQWRFVFIVEPDKKLVCPQPWCLDLRKLLPYSAVVELCKKP